MDVAAKKNISVRSTTTTPINRPSTQQPWHPVSKIQGHYFLTTIVCHFPPPPAVRVGNLLCEVHEYSTRSYKKWIRQTSVKTGDPIKVQTWLRGTKVQSGGNAENNKLLYCINSVQTGYSKRRPSTKENCVRTAGSDVSALRCSLKPMNRGLVRKDTNPPQFPGTDNMQKCESVIILLRATYQTKNAGVFFFFLHSPH
jgi:hypothetical protein